MARRDNQGIQIAMIVFILSTLVFMVTTYFGWSSSKNLQGELTALNSELATANSGLRSSEQLVSALKALIGLPSEVAEEEIQSAVNKTVETYGQGLPGENQNFQDILENMSTQILNGRGELADLHDENDRLQSDVEQIRKTEGALAAQAKAAETQAVADQNRERQESQAYLTKQDAVRNKLAQDLDASKRARNDLQTKTDATVAQVQGDLRQKELLLEQKTDQIREMTVDRPDQFDGNVVGVVAATGTVWLNVGRADGLRPKTTFSVWDAVDSNVRSAKRKASLEVTRFLPGDHRSEARVTDLDYLNPIVRNDHIFSPIWSPGQKLGIALVGSMDINNDGTDDRHYIRNLIKINGARIDAEDVDGTVQGKMTVNTRYLVVAEIDDDGDQNPALTPMLNDAARLGIEQTSVDELLDLMGYAGRARSVSFSGVVRPGDFAPKPHRGVTPTSTGSTSYSERMPLPRRNRADPSD